MRHYCLIRRIRSYDPQFDPVGPTRYSAIPRLVISCFALRQDCAVLGTGAFVKDNPNPYEIRFENHHVTTLLLT